MNKIVTMGLGAAAVVVLLFIGTQLFGSSSGGIGSPPEPTATAEPSPSPSATAAPPAPPLTQSFTSDVHGISVSYPEGWAAQAATAPWRDATFTNLFGEPDADFLYDPTLTDHLFLTFASQPLGDSTPDEWVAEHLESEEGCTATAPITVDGATGVIGAAGCDVVVLTSAGRGYWILLHTSDDDPPAVAAYDRTWFEEVLGTVQLHPEDAVD